MYGHAGRVGRRVPDVLVEVVRALEKQLRMVRSDLESRLDASGFER